MFLHLLRTDLKNKFSTPWRKMWEKVEPNNHFYVQLCDSVYVPPENSEWLSFVTNVMDFHKIVSDFNDIEGVVLSGCSVDSDMFEIIRTIPKMIPICLFSWGDFCPARYFKKTRMYYRERTGIKKRTKRALAALTFRNKILLHCYCSINKKYSGIFNFYNRIDMFASSMLNEFDSFIKKPNVNPNIIYCYGTVGCPPSEKVSLSFGNAIQIGNSAFFNNNHIDIFEMIKHLVKKGTKIIVPLTYGSDQMYVDYVIRQGFSFFGEDFVPLTKHLPYEEYQNLLNQCGFYISGQTTSTGLGNLHLALRRGAKVFVPQSCPMYAEYKKLGIPIFSLEDDLQSNPNAFTEFTVEEKLHCQNKLYENLNAERSLEGCRNILALLRKMRAERATDPRFN